MLTGEPRLLHESVSPSAHLSAYPCDWRDIVRGREKTHCYIANVASQSPDSCITLRPVAAPQPWAERYMHFLDKFSITLCHMKVVRTVEPFSRKCCRSRLHPRSMLCFTFFPWKFTGCVKWNWPLELSQLNLNLVSPCLDGGKAVHLLTAYISMFVCTLWAVSGEERSEVRLVSAERRSKWGDKKWQWLWFCLSLRPDYIQSEGAAGDVDVKM